MGWSARLARKKHKILAFALAAFLVGAPPASGQDLLYSQDSDGDGLADGYEDSNRNGVKDGVEGGGPGLGSMVAECLETAQSNICLAYFQFNCEYYQAALACDMARLGEACSRPETMRCEKLLGILRANKDCFLGDQTACAWIARREGWPDRA